MEVENFLKDINPLIEELRRYEKSGYNIQSLEEEIRSKTQKFIEEYEITCINKIEEVKQEIDITQDTEKMEFLKKELESRKKELNSFKEIMGNIDFSNSKYTYFLQTLIGRMEEKNMSRMSDGIVYEYGKKIENMQNFTVGDALNIINDETENTQFYIEQKLDKNKIARLKDEDVDVETPPPIYTMEDIEKEQQKNNLETLKTIFAKIECGFEDCLSPLYIKLKEKIFEDNRYEEAINNLQGLKIEDIYEKIAKRVEKFSINSPIRKKEEDMFEAAKTRRKELEKENGENSNNVKKDETAPNIQVQNASEMTYLSVKWKKRPSIFDNIKQIGKKVKNWFTTKKEQNEESKSLINISTTEDRKNFFSRITKGVQPIKTPNQSNENIIMPVEKEILE